MVNEATGLYRARAIITNPVRNYTVRIRLQVRPLADSAHTACRYQAPTTTQATRVSSAKGLVSHEVSTLWSVNPRRCTPGIPGITGTRSRSAQRPAYRPAA